MKINYLRAYGDTTGRKCFGKAFQGIKNSNITNIHMWWLCWTWSPVVTRLFLPWQMLMNKAWIHLPSYSPYDQKKRIFTSWLGWWSSGSLGDPVGLGPSLSPGTLTRSPGSLEVSPLGIPNKKEIQNNFLKRPECCLWPKLTWSVSCLGVGCCCAPPKKGAVMSLDVALTAVMISIKTLFVVHLAFGYIFWDLLET